MALEKFHLQAHVLSQRGEIPKRKASCVNNTFSIQQVGLSFFLPSRGLLLLYFVLFFKIPKIQSDIFHMVRLYSKVKV